MTIAITDPDKLKRASEDLPDLIDQDLLTEMYAVMEKCRPLGRTPSSARMRRILRTAIKLMEEKVSLKNEFSGRVCSDSALVEFRRNEHIQRAFEELEKHIPTKWADRGKLKFSLVPIDYSYGYPGNIGFISVTWKAGAPNSADKIDKTGQCTVVEAIKAMDSLGMEATELACPVGVERVNVELKITSRKPL